MRRRPVIRAVVIAVVLGMCLAIALARALEPDSRVMVIAATLSPLAAIGAGLCVVLAASILAHADTPQARWLLGAATALMVVHLWWFAPLVVGGQPPRPPGALQLRAMTLNVLGGRADAAQIVGAVRRERPGLLALTEVTEDALADLERAGIRRALPYRVGRTGDDGRGTVVYGAARVQIVATLPTRAYAFAVRTRVGPRAVLALAVHPVAPTEFARWRDDLAVVGRAAREQHADIVLGDLNATHDNRPFRAMLDDGGLRDSVELANAGWEPTFPANWIHRVLGVPLPAVAQLDHVLVRVDGGASRARTVAVDGTDHRGLLADVWLPNAPRTAALP